MLEQGSMTIVVMNVFAALIAHSWLKRCDPVQLSKATAVLGICPFLSVISLLLSQPKTKTSVSIFDILKAYAVFYATLSVSVIAYRLSPYHPLAKYPGPIISKVTKLWSAWIAYKGKNHVYFKALHDKYGPTVRIGPNEISTVEKDLIPDVFVMPKGPIWDGRRFAQTDIEVQKNYDSLVDVRDSTIHARLRKPWSKSFSAEPMQTYELLLLPRVAQLNQMVKETIMKTDDGIAHTNIAQWLNYFSFDFMGDIVFGGAFELMRDGDVLAQHRAMGDGMYLPSITQHIPWFANLSRKIPFMASGIQKLVKLGVAEGVKRSNKEIKHKDLFYYMTESTDEAESESGLEIIISNVLLAIVAGSDTSSSVMTNAIQLLLSHPQKYRLLQSEIDEAFNKHQIPDLDVEGEVNKYSDVLSGLKYLNAVINEVLRLFPAIPTGLQRAPAKNSGGKLLQGDKNCNIFLPEGSAICISPYVLHRDPRYFSPHPNDFLPERWLSDPSFTTARDAFIPFSAGPNNCVGRPLALMEIRYVLATLFRNFNMEFDATKYNSVQWENDRLDRFTLTNGDLNIKIRMRTKAMRGLG